MMRYLVSLLAVLLCLAQPAAAATSPSLLTLEQRLSTLLAGKSADVGLAAIDLKTGETVSIRGEHAYPMASTMKVAVAAAYLAQVDHGRRSLNDPIGKTTAGRLMEAMMIRSDNHATDLLIKNLGGPETVQQWLQWNGMTGLRVDRTIAQLLAARRDLRDTRDSSTPMAMVEMLRKIDTGNVLKPQSRYYILDLMRRCMTGKNRMKALLPANARVEHKTGTLNGYTSDVGFITLPDGRRIAVAMFARYGDDRPRTLAEAARAIYDGFVSAITYPFGSAAFVR